MKARPMSARLVAILGIIVVLSHSVQSQQRQDLSGTWQREPGRDVNVSRVDRGSARWGAIPYTTSSQPYIIKIVHYAEQIDVVFPGGMGNFLNGDPYSLSGQEIEHVRNEGDWWIKTTMQALWKGETLTLKATRLSNWWESAQLSEVTRQDTALQTLIRLSLDAASDELTVETTLSDEKGEVVYRQVFRRS